MSTETPTPVVPLRRHHILNVTRWTFYNAEYPPDYDGDNRVYPSALVRTYELLPDGDFPLSAVEYIEETLDRDLEPAATRSSFPVGTEEVTPLGAP